MHVLWIDNQTLSYAPVRRLIRRLGYDLDCVHSVREALDWLAQDGGQKPSVLILDAILPAGGVIPYPSSPPENWPDVKRDLYDRCIGRVVLDEHKPLLPRTILFTVVPEDQLIQIDFPTGYKRAFLKGSLGEERKTFEDSLTVIVQESRRADTGN